MVDCQCRKQAVWQFPYLIFLTRLEKQDIDNRQLRNVSVSFKLLPHLRPYG